MLELITPARMAEVDQAAIASGIPATTLMENAGQAVAFEVTTRFPLQPVLVLVGPGNNGGDGYVAARLLHERGWPVRVMALDARGARSAHALAMSRLWQGQHDRPDLDAIAEAGIIIDAMYGAGLSGDVSGEAARLIAAVNASNAHVVAIDMPTGVDGETGRVRGAALAADLTVTFFRLKPGHLLEPGRSLCGALELADIGIPDVMLGADADLLQQNDPALWTMPFAGAISHKYQRGHCVVVSGPRFMTGAARLAARGAARIGAGLVTLAGHAEALTIHAAHVTAIMLAEADGPAGLTTLMSDPRHNALVIGLGLPPDGETRALVHAALQSHAALVLDAGALSAFADTPRALAEAIAIRSAPVVLTPHGGEFARLFGAPAGSKLEATVQAAREVSAVVLHKGSDTIIAEPEGRARINVTGTPVLATAGTGDVLAGMIGGLLAQGMNGFDAASAAAHIHGLAGRSFGGAGLVADDLPDLLPDVLADLPPPVIGPGDTRRARLP